MTKRYKLAAGKTPEEKELIKIIEADGYTPFQYTVDAIMEWHKKECSCPTKNEMLKNGMAIVKRFCPSCKKEIKIRSVKQLRQAICGWVGLSAWELRPHRGRKDRGMKETYVTIPFCRRFKCTLAEHKKLLKLAKHDFELYSKTGKDMKFYFWIIIKEHEKAIKRLATT